MQRSGAIVNTTKPIEQPHVGDLCRMLNDEDAFATFVVADVLDDYVALERPHCKVSKIGECRGVVYVATERLLLPMGRFLADYEVYVTGASGMTHNVKG
jgi:hypothetical protein